MRILGIDPGSLVTGYGVVERAGGAVRHCAHGCLRSARGQPLAVRLAGLQAGLARVVAEHRPDLAVVERVFVAGSPRAALVLGHARGVLLATAAAAGLAVEELSAQEIKAAVVGSGRAEKAQVQAMVQRILGLARPPARDAADALAAALCRAHQGRLAGLPRRVGRRRVGASSSAPRASRVVVRLVR